MQGIEYHFFKDCPYYFEEKVRGFHKNFIDDWLLIGVHDDFNVDLESVEVIKNDSFNLTFCEKVVGGISNSKPLILISHFNEEKLESNCVIYYLNNDIDFEGFYMWQKVKGWNGSSKTCHQIWSLFEDDIFEINNYWLDE